MVAAYRRGTFGTGVVRGNGLALQQSGVVSLGSVAIPGDTNFASNVLLAKTTSVNTATNNTFLDSSTNNFTITRNGTPTQGSVTPYWPNGYWSNQFNGTAGTRISTPANTAFSFGTGDFTVEAWIYPTASPSGIGQIIGGHNSGSNADWVLFISATNYIGFYGTNGGTQFFAGAAVPLNQWTHIAMVIASTVPRIYYNGVLSNTGTASQIGGLGNATTITIGDDNTGNANSAFTGYISNLRVVKGTAVYTSNFALSTVPLTTISGTSLLTCQSNRFFDSNTQLSAKTVSVGGGAPTVQAFQPFSPPASYTTAAYGGSGYFDGSSQIGIANNAAFEIGSGDFSYEAFVFATTSSNGTVQGIISYGISGGLTAAICSLELSISGVLHLAYASASVTLTDTVALPLNQWVHCVACRSGTTLSLYVNGTRKATTTTSGTVGTGGAMVFGGQWYAAASSRQLQNGYISSARVLKNASAYDATLSTLTIPTSPLTAITNTSLLLNFANAGIYDAAVQNNEVTVGDAQASTTQYKWSPSSMKFDGTEDRLTAVDGPQLQLGTGDFTIDGWVYLSATGVAYGIISKGAAATGWSVNVTSGNKLQFSYTASNLTGATSLAASTWYYFAVVRSGSATGNLKVYLNGAVDATSGGAVTDNFNQTSILYIGADRVGGSALNGYLQDIRVTKYARTISTPTTNFSAGTATTYTPAVPDAPIIANITTITNTSVKIGYMAPLLNGGSTITSYTAVSTPGGITGTSITARSGTITVGGLVYSNTYTFAVYATNAIGTSTFSAASKSITTPAAQLGKIFILSDMDLALTDLVLLNTTIASGISKAKTYALATIYGSD